MPQKLNLHIPNPARQLKIIKHHAGSEKIYTWSGQLLSGTPNSRRVNACFNGNPGYAGKVLLEPGDRFVESYFTDCWYNFFPNLCRTEQPNKMSLLQHIPSGCFLR